jgi:hypothetical protein
VVVLHKDWKQKQQVDPTCNPPRMESTQSRIFVAASNVDRKKQEGCMNKIKIERTAKLVQEDHRHNSYNILSGAILDNRVWANAMGSQSEGFKIM